MGKAFHRHFYEASEDEIGSELIRRAWVFDALRVAAIAPDAGEDVR